MINENLKKSISLLEKDASFIKNIKDVIDANCSPDENKENINKAMTWILHVLDYFVTLDMIDMDADLLRLCNEDAKAALKFRNSLNDVGLSLKANYQILCKDGTIYGPEGLPLFKLYYKMALLMAIDSIETNRVITTPDYVIDFSAMEFIITPRNDVELLKQKLNHLENIDFSLDSIKGFINNCLSWSDSITDYTNRRQMDKSVFDFNTDVLRAIHKKCNGMVYGQTSPNSFEKAIKNLERPVFRVIIKDYFYAILYALFERMGTLSSREGWLASILTAFELEKKDYSSTVKRIKDEKTEKLTSFYKEIVGILELHGN